MIETAVHQITVKGEIVREVIETHVSWVLLTDEYAFKLKKELRFSFLDFSTLEKRKFFCERELILNRRLAPSMYLKVVPVCQNVDGLVIYNENDQIMDYAVVMKRMDNNLQMHVLLEQNKVTKKEVLEIANVIARFHTTASVINTPFDVHNIAATFNDILSVADFVQEELGHGPRKTIDQSISYSNEFILCNQTEFEKRIEKEMVRDCHGDLHSGNIFLYNEPVIFDCIEFHDGFRQIDLLNEISFFCMDLDAFGRTDLGEAFLKEYLGFLPQVMATEFDKQLFTYYKLSRANVRAKIAAIKAQQHLSDNQLGMTKEVELYLQLMNVYLVELMGKNH